MTCIAVSTTHSPSWLEKEIVEDFARNFSNKPSEAPIIILVGGFQGSGKSTLISKIQANYPVNVISKDAIRGTLFNNGVLFSEDFPPMVDAIYKDLLTTAIASSLNIVIDNNTHSKRLAEIQDNIPLKYRTLKILLTAKDETLIDRVRTRKPTPGSYNGTEEELKHALSVVTYDAEDYDLAIDTDKYNQTQVFDKVKHELDLQGL